MVTYNEKEIYEFQNITHIIYRIMNLINNKVYIGQTIHTFNHRYGRGSKCRYCSDCKRKIDYEKQKEKILKSGKEIKICPICGKEHWKPSDYCCAKCKRRAKDEIND